MGSVRNVFNWQGGIKGLRSSFNSGIFGSSWDGCCLVVVVS